MTERALEARGAATKQGPTTGDPARAHEAEPSPLTIHHHAEGGVIGDPGPVGFDFILPDDGPEVLWVLSRDFTWRRVSMKDDGVNDC